MVGFLIFENVIKFIFLNSVFTLQNLRLHQPWLSGEISKDKQIYGWSFIKVMSAMWNFLNSVNFIDQMVCRMEFMVNTKPAAECSRLVVILVIVILYSLQFFYHWIIHNINTTSAVTRSDRHPRNNL